jgi:hypothetical protein
MHKLGDIIAESAKKAKEKNTVPTVSAVLHDGALLEMVYCPEEAPDAVLRREGRGRAL